jgi:gas vesicle protein
MANREYDKQETAQSRTTEESSNSFLLGALIGGVVGAVTALLLAPKPGKELRRTLSSQAGSILDKTEQLRENVRIKSNKLVTKTSGLSQGVIEQSTGLINKVKSRSTNQSECGGETESNYISIGSPKKKGVKKPPEKGTLDNDEIRKKLVEAQKAFEEEENKVKL